MQCLQKNSSESKVSLKNLQKLPIKFVSYLLRTLEIKNLYSVLRYLSSVLWYISKQLVKLALQVPTQYSNFVVKNTYIQNKLRSHALKGDLKFTLTVHAWRVMKTLYGIQEPYSRDIERKKA